MFDSNPVTRDHGTREPWGALRQSMRCLVAAVAVAALSGAVSRVAAPLSWEQTLGTLALPPCLVVLALLFRRRYPVLSVRWRMPLHEASRHVVIGLAGGAAFAELLWATAGPRPWVTCIVMPLYPLRASIMVVVACTVAPIAEEIFWRLTVYAALRATSRLLPALIGQAALFTLCHLRLIGWGSLFIFGIVAALAFEKTRGPYLPAGFHVGFNCCLFFLSMHFLSN
jgi:membrane protease YdiL (CAAX protease family)